MTCKVFNGRVTVAYHPATSYHDPGPHHPERMERARVVAEALRAAPFADRLDWIEPGPCVDRWLELVHGPDYLRFVEEACLSGRHVLDLGDTRVSEESHEAARLASGGALAAVDAVVEGRATHAFAVHRPPGHHARYEAAMGFCLFNHVAVAARYAQRRHGIERVAIVDWDVHHGNGTQETFHADPSVFFASLHQWPHYPGSGASWERGSGAGVGTTLNLPMPAGSSGADWLAAFDEQLIPALRAFAPGLILVSAGFDAHREDPLAGVNLVEADFAAMTRRLAGLASELGIPGLVSVLEGGYNLRALAASAVAHVGAMLGD